MTTIDVNESSKFNKLILLLRFSITHKHFEYEGNSVHCMLIALCLMSLLAIAISIIILTYLFRASVVDYQRTDSFVSLGKSALNLSRVQVHFWPYRAFLFCQSFHQKQ